jgi:hypothetical protein
MVMVMNTMALVAVVVVVLFSYRGLQPLST